jgi:hypothetical protein
MLKPITEQFKKTPNLKKAILKPQTKEFEIMSIKT